MPSIGGGYIYLNRRDNRDNRDKPARQGMARATKKKKYFFYKNKNRDNRDIWGISPHLPRPLSYPLFKQKEGMCCHIVILFLEKQGKLQSTCYFVFRKVGEFTVITVILS
jgi:Neuraminidase (sialidase)